MSPRCTAVGVPTTLILPYVDTVVRGISALGLPK